MSGKRAERFCKDCGYGHSPQIDHADEPLPGSRLFSRKKLKLVDQVLEILHDEEGDLHKAITQDGDTESMAKALHELRAMLASEILGGAK